MEGSKSNREWGVTVCFIWSQIVIHDVIPQKKTIFSVFHYRDISAVCASNGVDLEIVCVPKNKSHTKTLIHMFYD